MGYIALKKPNAIKTVVSTGKHTAEIVYAKPVTLGTIVYENKYWYTQDRVRFVSSRDAMEYLIKMHEAGTPVTSPAPVAAVVDVKSEPRRSAAVTVKKHKPSDSQREQLLAFLKDHIEFKGGEVILKGK